MKYQAPRGTQDILPKSSATWLKIIDIARTVFEKYSYKYISTPIFEHTELFQRSVGESSDIVNKEMYTFLDRSDRSLTLRPEGTAGIVRSFIENGLHREPKPVKLWTTGPMFRYERPQVGRFRQFHQIDAEILGSTSISCEIESIFMLSEFFHALNIDCSIEINSLGDSESRKNYKEYFQDFTKTHLGDLCEDCNRRFEQNPLRMLDCKVPEDQNIYAKAKKPIEFLSEKSEKRWEETKNILGLYKDASKRAIKNITINPTIVRGLDYYNDFVFEIKSNSEVLKGQSTICAGGRYDTLVADLGGPETPGFGFGIGIERLMLITEENKNKPISLLFISNQAEIFEIVSNFSNQTKNNITFEVTYNPNNIGKQIEQAIKKNIDFIVFYLDEEKEKNILKVKNIKTREEKECTIDHFKSILN